jgi:hypothetical protein
LRGDHAIQEGGRLSNKELGRSRSEIGSATYPGAGASLSASLHEETLGNAESHLKGVSDRADAQTHLASRVEAALLARFGPFQEVLTQSAHGGEIYDENSRLCGDLALNSSARFRGMLVSAMKSAARTGEINLKTAGLTASATAELIHLCAAGLKQGAPDVAAFEKRLHGFVKVFFAGLR